MKRHGGLIIGLLVMIVIPFLAGPSNLDPLFRGILMASVVLGLDLVMGYAGQISLGQAAFMGTGGYLSALLAMKLGVPSVLSVLIAAGVTGLVAYAIGLPLLRLRGYYLAIGTLAFGMGVEALATALYQITGGPAGLTGVPELGWGEYSLRGRLEYYFLACGLFLSLYYFASNLTRSRIGRSLMMIKSDEDAAKAMGIDVVHTKCAIFALGAIYSSLAGGVMAHYLGLVVPSYAGVLASAEVVIMLLLGGEGSLGGSIIGAVLWQFMPFVVHAFNVPRELMVGGILAALIILFPRGLFPIVDKLSRHLLLFFEKRSRPARQQSLANCEADGKEGKTVGEG